MSNKNLKCSKCGRNKWKAAEELDEDIDMLYLTCRCGNVWTALLN